MCHNIEEEWYMETWQCGIHRAYSYNSTSFTSAFLTLHVSEIFLLYRQHMIFWHEGRFACKLRGGDVVTSADDSDRFHRLASFVLWQIISMIRGMHSLLFASTNFYSEQPWNTFRKFDVLNFPRHLMNIRDLFYYT